MPLKFGMLKKFPQFNFGLEFQEESHSESLNYTLSVTLYFSQGCSLYFFFHFYSFMLGWGLKVGCWIGFLGFGFSFDGVWGLWFGPSGFLGLGLCI